MSTPKHKLKKELGQNFLTSQGVIKKMVDSLEIKEGDLVVEIGAGMGAVTDVIAKKVKDAKAEAIILEIDKRFVKDLEERYKNNSRIKVVEGDVLRWLVTYRARKNFKVIGSLPYYITSPILHSIVRHINNISLAVILIQKEVAEKIAKKCPDASYLSTYLQTFYKVEIVKNVPKENFSPIPKVDGSVVKMTKLDKLPVSKKEAPDYEEFLHNGFSKPRKMLNKVFSKETLNSKGIDEKLRPQHIKVEEWVDLFKSR
jgi:16S rRNA (adenine1518-N6/adenine1519-N6)-dimethyltransferase